MSETKRFCVKELGDLKDSFKKNIEIYKFYLLRQIRKSRVYRESRFVLQSLDLVLTKKILKKILFCL